MAASIVLDRLSGYFAMVVVVLSALLLFGREIIIDKVVFLILGIILSLSVGFLAILFNNFLFSRVSKLLHFFGRTGEVLKNLHFEIYNFRNQKRIIIKNFAYSLIIQLMIPFSFYLISFALSARISPIYFFVLVPIIATISALPISIAGLGLREASSVYFFTKVGMSSEVALATPLLSFFIIFLFGLCGGIIYVITFSHRRVQRNQAG